RHIDRAMRPQLASEAHIGWRADAAQDAQLLLLRGICAARFAAHPYSAGRTAAATTADMGMRNPGEPARLEHAGAGHDLDKATVGIADAHEAATPLPSAADEPGQQHRRYRADEHPGQGTRDFFENARGFRRRQGHVREGFAG